MKVLLFANDLLPFGSLPTSGGGLRCYQLMRGLQAHGVEVVVSMPGFTYLAEKHRDEIPPEVRPWLWRWETQDAIVRRVRPDALLFASNWDHFNLASDHGLPLVVDLHGSRLIETRMWGHPIDPDRKLQVLGGADCLLCAGLRQRSYFYGWLVQAGRVPAGEHFIRYVPVSQDPEQPEHVFPSPGDANAPVLVSGGGWFPWQDQSRAIFAACRAVTGRDRGTVHLYGTPHDTPHTSAEDRAIRRVFAEVKDLSERSPRICMGGYVGRDRLLEVYRHASVALEAMRPNLERELAFTTRTIEYLWCGLPVLYNDYAEIAGHIREYDAGWTIDPDSDAAISAALEEIFDDPAAVVRKGGNAQRLVRDRFSWERTIVPLVEFLRSPVKAPQATAARGAVSVPASYLEPSGEPVEVVLAPEAPVRQPFVVPADAVRAIEVPLSAGGASSQAVSLRMELWSRDRCIHRQVAPAGGPAGVGPVLTLPWHRRIRAGQTLRLELRLEGAAPDAAAVVLGGLRRPVFPLLAPAGGGPTLALRFVRRTGRVEWARHVSRRAWDLLRSGQGRVLVRAAARRLPPAARPLARLLGRL